MTIAIVVLFFAVGTTVYSTFQSLRPMMKFDGNRGYADMVPRYTNAKGALPASEKELRDWANENWEHAPIPPDAFENSDFAWGLPLQEFYHDRKPFILSIRGDTDLARSLDRYLRDRTPNLSAV